MATPAFQFPGVAPRRKRAPARCVGPGCTNRPRHRHHILYTPPRIARLCISCHQAITAININRTEHTRRKLSNEERLELWKGWLNGTIAPVYTDNVLRWLEQWH